LDVVAFPRNGSLNPASHETFHKQTWKIQKVSIIIVLVGDVKHFSQSDRQNGCNLMKIDLEDLESFPNIHVALRLD
jgi:hypothetical protein